MKKLAALVVGVVLLLTAAPWVIGRLAEARVNRSIDTMLAVSPSIRIVDRQWQPGWFRSQQQLTFEVILPGVAALIPAAALAGSGDASLQKPLRFQVHNDVLHGPLLGLSGIGFARVNTHVQLNERVRQNLIELFGSAEPVTVRTRVGFFGGSTTTLAGDARSLALDKLGKGSTGSISWDRFSLSVGISASANHFDVSGRQPRIEIIESRGGSQFRLEDLTVDGDGERIEGDLFAGDVKFGIAHLHVASGASPAVDVEDIHYGVDVDREGDYLEYVAKMGSGAVRTDSLKSTGLDIRKIHYDFTVGHLQIETLQKIMADFKTMYSTAPGANDPEVALQPFRDHGLELLQHEPVFLIDRVGIETPEGKGLMKGVIRFEGVTVQDSAAGIMDLLPKLVVDITVEVDQALLEKLSGGATMAGAAIDGGYAKRDGGKLVSHVEFRNGQLTVNGKAQRVPLPGVGISGRGEPAPLQQ